MIYTSWEQTKSQFYILILHIFMLSYELTEVQTYFLSEGQLIIGVIEKENKAEHVFAYYFVHHGSIPKYLISNIYLYARAWEKT